VQDEQPIDDGQDAPQRRRRRDALTQALGHGDLVSGLDAGVTFNGASEPNTDPGRARAAPRPPAYRSPARPRQATPLRGRASRRGVARANADWRQRLEHTAAARRP
jgi:hypothetical protein